jgi:hypothetical protein
VPTCGRALRSPAATANSISKNALSGRSSAGFMSTTTELMAAIGHPALSTATGRIGSVHGTSLPILPVANLS